MVSDLGSNTTRGCSLRFWMLMTACTAAVCSLTAASAFLLQAVLLETTGRTNNYIFVMWLREASMEASGLWAIPR